MSKEGLIGKSNNKYIYINDSQHGQLNNNSLHSNDSQRSQYSQCSKDRQLTMVDYGLTMEGKEPGKVIELRPAGNVDYVDYENYASDKKDKKDWWND